MPQTVSGAAVTLTAVETHNIRLLLEGLAKSAIAAENIPLMAAFALEIVDRHLTEDAPARRLEVVR